MNLRDKIEQTIREYRNHHPSEAADAILSVIAESMDLEWCTDKYGTFAKDPTSAANAEYRMYENAYGKWMLGGVLVGMEQVSEHETKEAAKAAAQKDYARRVLSALGLNESHTD
ncbi:hypothetical protein [Phaeobacter italicus]|jgi:hypothetical protein|uniref:hypothetical protein n=1 Tax=Phaeobacter italicus TaxID=481446 RepID=UPI002FDDA3C1